MILSPNGLFDKSWDHIPNQSRYLSANARSSCRRVFPFRNDATMGLLHEIIWRALYFKA